MRQSVSWGAAAVALGLVAGCGDADVAPSAPATGDAVDQYSRNITEGVSLGNDAELVQLLCVNTTGAACPADIGETLKSFGYSDGGTGVDLAYAFTLMAADAKDGQADQASTDEDFLSAAYRVALAREPDAGGAQANLAFIKDTGQRKTMLRSLLESEEFRSK